MAGAGVEGFLNPAVAGEEEEEEARAAGTEGEGVAEVGEVGVM
jgi:hypothetical protein